MNFHELLCSPFVQRVGWTLLHSLWQVTGVAALAWLGMTLLRRRTPQARYLAACVAMAAMLALSAATFFYVHPAPAFTPAADDTATVSKAQAAAISGEDDHPTPSPALPDPVEQPVAAAPAAHAPAHASPADPVAAATPPPPIDPWPLRLSKTVEPYLPWLVAAWLVGLSSLSLWRLGGWIAAVRLRVIGTRPVGPDVQALLARLLARLGLRRPVSLVQSLVVQTPMVIGWLRPVVLLPVSIVTGLTPAQIEAIVAHELAHIRRHDYLLNLLQTAVETVLFYHPAVWWISRRVRLERERCCDDMAVALCGDHIGYAEALAAVEHARMALPSVAASSLGGKDLLERVRRILGLAGPGSSRTALASAALAVALVAAVIIVPVACSLTGPANPKQPPTPAAGADTLSTSSGPGTQPATALQAQIDRLVAELGAGKWAQREAAQEALLKIGLPSLATLQKASGDPDPERASRAKTLVKQIRDRHEREAIDALVRAIKRDLPPDWSVAQVRHGEVSPIGRPAGRGWEIRTLRSGYKPVDMKRGISVEGLLWIMDSDYATVEPPHVGTPPPSQVGPAAELPQWHGRRAFEFGGTYAAKALQETRTVDDVRKQWSVLVARFKSKDERYWNDSIRELEQWTDARVIPEMVADFRNKDVDAHLRRSILSCLGRMEDRKAVPIMIEAAKDMDAQIRSYAVACLGRMGGPEAYGVITAALKAADASIWPTAITAMGTLRDPRSLDILLKFLGDGDDVTRRYAAEGLGELGDQRARPHLADAMKDKSELVRRFAVLALARLGDSIVLDRLLAALKTDVDGLRGWAPLALGQLGDKRAVEPLIAAMEDRDVNMRCSVVRSLGKLNDPRAVAPLLAALKDRDYIIRLYAAQSLGELGDPRAIEALKPLLLDTNDSVCAAASNALKKLQQAASRPAANLTEFESKALTNAFERWLDGKEWGSWDRPNRPGEIPRSGLDVVISAPKPALVTGRTYSATARKDIDALVLPIEITNRSGRTIKTKIANEWYGGEWPLTDLFAAVIQPPEESRNGRSPVFSPVFLVGNSRELTQTTEIKPGQSISLSLRMDWPGTGSVRGEPLVAGQGTYKMKLLLVFEADGKKQAVESGPIIFEHKLPQPATAPAATPGTPSAPSTGSGRAGSEQAQPATAPKLNDLVLPEPKPGELIRAGGQHQLVADADLVFVGKVLSVDWASGKATTRPKVTGGLDDWGIAQIACVDPIRGVKAGQVISVTVFRRNVYLSLWELSPEQMLYSRIDIKPASRWLLYIRSKPGEISSLPPEALKHPRIMAAARIATGKEPIVQQAIQAENIRRLTPYEQFAPLAKLLAQGDLKSGDLLSGYAPEQIRYAQAQPSNIALALNAGILRKAHDEDARRYMLFEVDELYRQFLMGKDNPKLAMTLRKMLLEDAPAIAPGGDKLVEAYAATLLYVQHADDKRPYVIPDGLPKDTSVNSPAETAKALLGIAARLEPKERELRDLLKTAQDAGKSGLEYQIDYYVQLQAGLRKLATSLDPQATQPATHTAATPSPGFDEEYAAARKENPSGVTLEISVPKTTYHVGETIPVTLKFRNASTQPYQVWAGTYGRSGRIWDVSFALDGPAGGWADPLEFFSQFYLGTSDLGGLGHYAELDEHAQTFDLNEWVRFDKPGNYRCYCQTSRVQADDKGQRRDVVSQVIEFKIVPADEAFVRATLTGARRDLNDDKLRGQAVRTLRFLATPEAVEVLAGLTDDPRIAREAMFGLICTRDRAQTLTTLRRKLDDPDVALNHSLETAIVELSLSPDDRPVIGTGPHGQKSYAKQIAALKQKETSLAAELAAHVAKGLQNKRGRAMVSTCAHLLFNAKMNNPQLRRNLAANFSLLTPDEGESVLDDSQWPLVKCPEFESALAKIVSQPLKSEQWGAAGEQSLAVLRYGEFQPQKARALILADIRLPMPNLARKAALSLPAEAIPADFDAVLLKNLTGKPEGDLFKIVPLIEHYGTKAMLPDVMARYRQAEGRWACGIEESFLRFWIKHDRPAGLEALVRAARSRQTGCYKSVLVNTLTGNWQNDLQRFLLPFLEDPSADLAVQAAQLLKENGDSQCVEPMIAALARRPATTQRAETDDRDQLGARHAIISALVEGKHFRITPGQRGRISDLLKTDSEKSQFLATVPTPRPAPGPATAPATAPGAQEALYRAIAFLRVNPPWQAWRAGCPGDYQAGADAGCKRHRLGRRSQAGHANDLTDGLV